MRTVIIGGSGHVGTYLVPRLVEAGFEVIEASRGKRGPYRPHPAWKDVQNVRVDRKEEEKAGTFGKLIAGLKPDIVIDMICFTEESARQLVEALKGSVQHFLFCGSLWVYGCSTIVPAKEGDPRHPIGEYGIQKARIEDYLIRESRMNRFPATVLHPGHIVGPGWVPVNPAGNINTDVFARIIKGEETALPNFGMETLHHVHADDVAQIFMQAVLNWSNSAGESFHAVSEAAVTMRGYAEAAYAWFGKEANIKFMPWEEWRKTVSKEDAEVTWDHMIHSPNCSIEKAKRLLQYQPRYTSLQAIYEAVNRLVENGTIKR